MKKIAIKIDNKRQFDALMKYYNLKGWGNFLGVDALKCKIDNFPIEVHYSDGFQCNIFTPELTNIIDFSTFSQLTGVEVVNEVILEISQSFNAVVLPEIVLFKKSGTNEAHPIVYLTNKNIEEIYTAYKSLQS